MTAVDKLGRCERWCNECLKPGVRVDGEIIGEIEHGVLALIGVTHDDTPAQATKLAEKIAHLRIFTDDDDKMNLSVLDAGGSVLVVSQFTLYGDTRKGRRPGYVDAARPEVAEPLCDAVVDALRALDVPVQDRPVPSRHEGRTHQRRTGHPLYRGLTPHL